MPAHAHHMANNAYFSVLYIFTFRPPRYFNSITKMQESMLRLYNIFDDSFLLLDIERTLHAFISAKCLPFDDGMLICFRRRHRLHATPFIFATMFSREACLLIFFFNALDDEEPLHFSLRRAATTDFRRNIGLRNDFR